MVSLLYVACFLQSDWSELQASVFFFFSSFFCLALCSLRCSGRVGAAVSLGCLSAPNNLPHYTHNNSIHFSPFTLHRRGGAIGAVGVKSESWRHQMHPHRTARADLVLLTMMQISSLRGSNTTAPVRLDLMWAKIWNKYVNTTEHLNQAIISRGSGKIHVSVCIYYIDKQIYQC